jgi:hypothetical protein
MAENEFAPCRLLDNGDGRYSPLLTEFDATASVFEEMGQEGGGYGWHGVVEALVRMKAPGLARKVKYDPEASMFVAYGKNRAALEKVAGLIRAAIQDAALLRQAVENADPE